MEFEKKYDLTRTSTDVDSSGSDIRVAYGKYFRQNNRTGEMDVLALNGSWVSVGRFSRGDIILAGLVPANPPRIDFYKETALAA